MGNGLEKVDDASEDRALRRQARSVVVKSLAVAAILTAIVYALPFP